MLQTVEAGQQRDPLEDSYPSQLCESGVCVSGVCVSASLRVCGYAGMRVYGNTETHFPLSLTHLQPRPKHTSQPHTQTQHPSPPRFQSQSQYRTHPPPRCTAHAQRVPTPIETALPALLPLLKRAVRHNHETLAFGRLGPLCAERVGVDHLGQVARRVDLVGHTREEGECGGDVVVGDVQGGEAAAESRRHVSTGSEVFRQLPRHASPHHTTHSPVAAMSAAPAASSNVDVSLM